MSPNIESMLSRTATSQNSELEQTIEKTFDYIDGGFTKPDALLLCDAQPLFDIPNYVKDFLQNHEQRSNFYTHVDGEEVLLDTLSLCAHQKGLHYQKKENILVTAGAYNGFSAVCHALCDPGDVILALSPTYILFANCTKAYGAELVLVPSVFNGRKFLSTAEALQQKINLVRNQNRNIKALLIINPTNVDGQFWTEVEMDEIAPVIQENELLVIEDRVYDELFFDPEDEEPAFFANHPTLAPQCITIDSISKRYGATQWRIGWIYGPEKFIRIAKDYVMNSVWSPAAHYQQATAYMLAADLAENTQALTSSTSNKSFIENALQHKRAHEAYFQRLHAGYKERRDLCILLINGQETYDSWAQNSTRLTSSAQLIHKYEKHLIDNNMDLSGIPGFHTPIMPKSAMFMAIKAGDELMATLADYSNDTDQILHRLIYLNTKVVLLPPSEITLPARQNFYRMEYGVSPEKLFKALAELQKFTKYWLALTLAEQKTITQQALATLPEKYQSSPKTVPLKVGT